MDRIRTLIKQNENKIIEHLIEMAKKGEYTRYTSTRKADWLLSIREINSGIFKLLEDRGQPDYLHVDDCFDSDPAMAFGIKEAELHRSRGVTLAMFLGLTKYYRKAYLELIKFAGELNDYEREKAERIIDLYFDRFEIGFCRQWSNLSPDSRIIELEEVNRLLTNEKNKFHTIFNSMAEPVIVVDSERRIKEINKAAIKAFKLDYKNVINRTCYDIFQCKHKMSQCPLLQAMQEASSYENLEITATINGQCKRFLVSGSALDDFSGKFAGGVEVFIDVTEARENEQKLLKAIENADLEAAKLRAMISGMGEGVVFADENEIITEVNEFFLKLFGKNRSDLIGQSIYNFHESVPMNNVKTLINSFKSDHRSSHISINKNINGLDLIMRVQPIYGNGRYQGVLLNIIDVSELAKAKIEAERARELAESANRAKSEFLANMSHEIRTPMNGILGFAEILLSQNIAPEHKDSLKSIVLCGEHLLELINDVLDLSKIESGKMIIEETRFSLERILEEAITTVRQKAYEKGLAIKVVFNDLPEEFIGDCTKIRQVLANLLSNAVKFTLKGSVEIVIGRGQGECVCDDIIPLQVEVKDTGIGIPGDKRELIFDPFTQADGSTARKFGGTGLGLSICRRLVELMGGEIWVRANHPRGSIFSFCIPVRVVDGNNICAALDFDHGSAKTTAESYHLQRKNPVPYKILLAEDNAVNQKIIKTFLESEGYYVYIVKDGLDVLPAMEKDSFDLVLMDMQMPYMDGYEATSWIRKYSKWDHIPIVAITAYAMKGDEEKCIRAGCDYYISKPVRKDELLTVLAKMLNVRPEGPAAGISRGYQEDIQHLIPFFISNVKEELEKARILLKHMDFKALYRIGHGLKGSCSTYGFSELSELGIELEYWSEARDVAAIDSVLDRLQKLIYNIEQTNSRE